MLVSLGRQVVPSCVVERRAEFLIGGGLVAAEDSILVVGGEAVGRLVVQRLHDPRVGVGRFLDLFELAGIELAQFVLGNEPAGGVLVELGVGQHGL